MTTPSNRSPGCFRGYTNEQKTLRAKLAQLLKWTRDLKSNLMKQSCKVLQTNHNSIETNRQLIDQIHDDLDDYKRKLDRELGRIHDMCDALINNQVTNGNEENLQDEILEALRRSPTYSSLEQHIYDDKRSRIRVKPRERIHPGQKQTPRAPFLSTNTIKRKVSQPIALQVIDTSSIPGAKRRTQVNAFRRSRSFTNVEHTETQLGMDYVEEDESDISWKPFGPKRSISHVSLTSTHNERSNDEQPSTSSMTTSQSLPTISTEQPKSSSVNDDNSSDEEFDVAWERRAKQRARKGITSPPPPPPAESPSKRSVRFAPSRDDPVDLIELDLDETTQDGLQQIKDQNNNNNKNKQQAEVVSIDDDDDDEITMPATDTQSQITATSTQQGNTQDDNSDDEIIALSDDDEMPQKSTISRRKTTWTTSEIQISSGNSQSQSLHNPYRVGIADPSLRSVFLPPPNSQSMSGFNSGNRRTQGGNRKTSPTKRGASAK